MNSGTSRDLSELSIIPGSSPWDDSNKSLLPTEDAISQMWQETLVHYAAEATEYEQKMTKQGRPMLEDPSAFPAKCLPIHLAYTTNMINASAGINPETGMAEANVTQGFVDKLDAGQQRAILFHEAQHSFDAVIAGKTPSSSLLSRGIAAMATSNHTARNGEFRADEHAARMGMGAEMESAFNQMEADMGQYHTHNAKVLHLLDKSGLKFDADGVRGVVDHVKDAISKNNVNYVEEKTALKPVAAQEFFPLPNPIKITKKVLGKVGKTVEKAQDNILVAQVNHLNEKLSSATAHVAASSQPEQAVEPAPKSNGLVQKLGKVAEALDDARRTHPKHTDRIERLKRVDLCKGCADPSPFASHADRVKAISDTGIQGITPSR